jgi:hypothetical protein
MCTIDKLVIDLSVPQLALTIHQVPTPYPRAMYSIACRNILMQSAFFTFHTYSGMEKTSLLPVVLVPFYASVSVLNPCVEP